MVRGGAPTYTHDGWDVGRGGGLRWVGLQRGCSYSPAPSHCGYRHFAPLFGISDDPFLCFLIPGVLPPSSSLQDLVAPTKPYPGFLHVGGLGVAVS